MFAVIVAEIILVIVGGILVKRLKTTKELNWRILIILSAIGISGLILWLNHKFIESPYNWIVSAIFISSMFMEYFRPYTPEKWEPSQDNYRGD